MELGPSLSGPAQVCYPYLWFTWGWTHADEVRPTLQLSSMDHGALQAWRMLGWRPYSSGKEGGRLGVKAGVGSKVPCPTSVTSTKCAI